MMRSDGSGEKQIPRFARDDSRIVGSQNAKPLALYADRIKRGKLRSAWEMAEAVRADSHRQK